MLRKTSKTAYLICALIVSSAAPISASRTPQSSSTSNQSNSYLYSVVRLFISIGTVMGIGYLGYVAYSEYKQAIRNIRTRHDRTTYQRNLATMLDNTAFLDDDLRNCRTIQRTLADRAHSDWDTQRDWTRPDCRLCNRQHAIAFERISRTALVIT